MTRMLHTFYTYVSLSIRLRLNYIQVVYSYFCICNGQKICYGLRIFHVHNKSLTNEINSYYYLIYLINTIIDKTFSAKLIQQCNITNIKHLIEIESKKVYFQKLGILLKSLCILVLNYYKTKTKNKKTKNIKKNNKKNIKPISEFKF